MEIRLNSRKTEDGGIAECGWKTKYLQNAKDWGNAKYLKMLKMNGMLRLKEGQR